MFQDEKYRQSWEALVGESHDSFETKVLKGFPDDAKMMIEYQGDDFFFLDINGIGYEFGYVLTPGITSKFRDAHTIETGKNISALASRNILPILYGLGITKMEVHAAQVGIYLWCRAGFKPFQDMWPSIASGIDQRVDYLSSLPGSDLDIQDISAIKIMLQSPNSKSLWDIAQLEKDVFGIKLGKLLILEWSPLHRIEHPALAQDAPGVLREQISWSGICDFNDGDCRKFFIAYAESAVKNDILRCTLENPTSPSPRSL